MAGKCKDEKLQIPEHNHVELLDRGDLWKVNTDAVAIFSVGESYFLSSSTKGAKNIDTKSIVSALMTNPCVLTHYSIIRDNSPTLLRKKLL